MTTGTPVDTPPPTLAAQLLGLPVWRTLGASVLLSAAVITVKSDPSVLADVRGLVVPALFVGLFTFTVATAVLSSRSATHASGRARKAAAAALAAGLVALFFPFTDLPDAAAPSPSTSAVAATPGPSTPSSSTPPPTATPDSVPTAAATAVASAAPATTPATTPAVAPAVAPTSAPTSAPTLFAATTAPRDLTAAVVPPAQSSAPTTSTTSAATDPGRLSNDDVLRADPDCVGGVCTLLARADLVKGGERYTIALVRFEDTQGYPDPWTHIGYLGVDARTRQLVTGSGPGATDVQVPTADDIHIDGQGNIAVITRSASSYDTGRPSIMVAGLSNGYLSNESLSLASTSPSSITYLADDESGRLRWTETVDDASGSSVTTTVAWGGYDFRVQSCTKTRNGETVQYRPTNGYSC